LSKQFSFLFSLFFSSATGSAESWRNVGVAHEVMNLCQQQDTVMTEMRHIDVELSQMYRSLIEIVARMSSLQRKRVEVRITLACFPTPITPTPTSLSVFVSSRG
jgi:hypothetical protein